MLPRTHGPQKHRATVQAVIVLMAFMTCATSRTNARQCAGWEEIAAPGPLPRSQCAMVYMEREGKTLLFGGGRIVDSRSVRYDDTWTWDGSDWTQLQVTGPTARTGANIAYDPVRDRVMLYGGLTAAGRPTDTWEWDGQQWHLLSETGPEISRERSMAFDPSIGRIILFEGSTGPARTWAWTGSRWLRIAINGPPMTGFVLVTDSVRGRVVLIASSPYNEIWEWDRNGWIQIGRYTVPEIWFSFDAAFDATRGSVILTGGVSDGVYNDETWEWDGDDWSLRSKDASLARSSHRLIYDASRNRLVLFGGRTDYQWFADTLEADPDTFLSIIDHPRSTIVIPGHDSGFQVRAVGSGPMTYQWRKDGAPLVDGERISGSQTASLRIRNVGESDVGAYDVFVRRECGELLSDPAYLTLRITPLLEVGGHCPGQVGLRLTRARPNGLAVLFYGGTRRQWFQWIEGCGPMYLDIGPPGAALVGLFRVDEFGSVEIQGYAAPGRCDGYLQFVDLRECLLSNVAEVP